ncbi:MAG TPA: hypothetical protein VK700_11805 [Steroidobacteraceae bacterium]|jgi:hypothetical protein|nr:hypothetical protein [Steroidobacteraceae bacterium]
MQFRTVSIWMLGVAGAVAALPGYGRGVIIEGSTCTAALKPTGTLWFDLTGTGSKGNRARAGLNLPVLSCTPDNEIQALSYKTAGSLLFTLVDLSVAQDTAAGFILANELAVGLSGLNQGQSNVDSTSAVAAQVAVLKLNGTFKGDTEIIFSYEVNLNLFPAPAGPSSVCDNLFKPIKPSFTWFGTTYEFIGGDGVSTPCDDAATNDFVFDSNGNLLGYRAAADVANGTSDTTLTAGLPPGWVIQ